MSKQRGNERTALVDGMMGNPIFVNFKTPVTKNILPDYDKFVTKKMDLSAIRKKLKHPGYPSAEAWMEDVRQIETNALLYHEADEAVQPRPKYRRGAPNAESACHATSRFVFSDSPPRPIARLDGGKRPRVLGGPHSASHTA